MGACTAVIKKRNFTGASKVVIADVTLSSSYAAGGDTLTPANLGFLNSIDFLVAAPNGGLVFEYDHSANKLKAFYPTGSTIAPATAIADPIISAGATAVTGSAATGPFAAGRGKELAATTPANTITCRVFAAGDNPYV